MHTAIRQICAGEVGSPADVIGSRCTADEPVPECPVEAGGVVSGAWVWGWAGVSALPVCVPSADSGVVSGVVLEVAGEDAVAAAFGCRLGVAVCGTATAELRCRPVVAGRSGPGCRGTWVSGCSDTESVVAVRGVAAATGSGGDDACVWLLEDLVAGSAATVRPPPTRATAVAATARRLFFFQRASCRRRAARPCPVAALPSGPLDEPVADASVVAPAGTTLPIGSASVR